MAPSGVTDAAGFIETGETDQGKTPRERGFCLAGAGRTPDPSAQNSEGGKSRPQTSLTSLNSNAGANGGDDTSGGAGASPNSAGGGDANPNAGDGASPSDGGPSPGGGHGPSPGGGRGPSALPRV